MSNEPLDYQQPESSDAATGADIRAAAGANLEAGSDISRALSNVLRQPSFLVVVVILLISAIGLNAAVNFAKIYFKKEPVALSHELGTIPARVGTWVQVTQDQPLDSEMQDVLGTNKYIF